MATWPTTLPSEFPEEGFSFQPPDTVIRTNMDIGPPKTRRRTSSNTAKISGTILMSSNQYNNAFLPFYYNNIGYGALAFNWTHPVDGSNCEMRFTATPKVSPAGGDYVSVQMEMEIMP